MAAQEIWQNVSGGVLRLSTGAEPTDPDDGIELTQGSGVLISSGLEVWYRRGGPAPVKLTRTVV